MLTLILLWSFVQWTAPWWLPEVARRYGDMEKHLITMDRTLTIIPVILVSIVIYDLASAHHSQDLTYAHVAQYGVESSSTLSRMVHGAFGPDSFPWIQVIFLFVLTTFVSEQVRWSKKEFDSLLGEGESGARRAEVLRWHGFIWLVILIGLIPSDTFAVYTEPQPFIGVDPSGATEVSRIVAGVSLGVWPPLIARFSQNGDHSKALFLSLILPISLCLLATQGLGGPSAPPLSELLSLGKADDLATVLALTPLFLAWPLFLSMMERVHTERGMAKGRRWLGLQRTLGHTLGVTWIGGAVILQTLPHIDGWGSAFWLSLTLTVPLAAVGLLGTILPMAGLDSRPRPEVWGFNLLIILTLPLLTIREPLTLVLVPGLFMSMTTLPLLATHPEKRGDLSVPRRIVESAVVFALTTTAFVSFHYGVQGNDLGMLIGIATCIVSGYIPMLLLSLDRSTSPEIPANGE